MKKDLQLIVTDAFTDDKHVRTEKLIKAVENLSNAMKVEVTLNLEHQEEMLPVVKEVVDEYIAEYWNVLNGLLSNVGQIFTGTNPLAKAKRVKMPVGIYNPKTGKPLAKKDWSKILDAIDGYLTKNTKSLAEKMASKGAAVGSLLNRLERTKAVADVSTLGYAELAKQLPKKFKVTTVAKKFSWNPDATVNLHFRVDNIADHVTDTNNKVKAGIKRVLSDGLQQQSSPKEIAGNLFGEFGKWNKDWERIANTEVQNSTVDGEMITELSDAKPGEDIYMIGAGSASACNICHRDVIGKVVKLLSAPPSGGDEGIDDSYTDTAIWPGKNSIGHGAKEKWTAIVRHPFCGCRLVRWYPAEDQVSTISVK